MSSGSRKKRKRKGRGRQRPHPAKERVSGAEAMERGYARSRAKNDEARARLKPLAKGERPTAVTVGAVVALILGVSNFALYLAGLKIAGKRPTLIGPAFYSGVLLLTAWGMWRARYWGVLGMQALLAITILVFALLAIKAESALALVIAIVVLAAAGTLFWFLIKAMARIQMPERPGAKR
jgi:hypothetical protein